MANTISVSVLGDVRDINRKLGNVEKQLGGFGKKISSVGRLMAGAFAGAAVGSFLVSATKDAEDAARQTRVLGEVFESMGDKGSKAFNQAVKDSTALSKSIAVDDGAIQAVQTKLATFGNVWKDPIKGADNFKRATTLAFDLAAAGFGTADGNAVQLGKALNDPAKGMAALAKSGVTFTDAEKKKIKSLQESGNLLGAQEILYKAIETQVGGAAKANVTGSQKMAVALAELKEGVGTALLPAFEKFATFVTNTLIPAFERFAEYFSANIWPKVQTFISGISAQLLPALQSIGTFITGTLVPAFSSFVGWLVQNHQWLAPIAVGILAIVAAWKAYQTYLAIVRAVTIAYTAVQAALNVVMAMNPIGLLVLAIVGLIAALIYVWKTNEGFRNAVIKVWNAIKTGVMGVVNWFRTTIPEVWNTVKNATTTAWNAVKTAVANAVKAVKDAVAKAWESVKTGNLAAWTAVKDTVAKVWEGIKSAVSTAIGSVVSTVKGLKGKVTGALSGAASWLVGIGKNVVEGLISGIGSLAGSVTSALLNLLPGPLRKFANKLGINSPSTVFKGFGKNIGQGLILGIENMGSKVTKTAAGLAGDVASGFQAPRLSLAGAAGGGYGTTVQIDVSVPVGANPAETGRQVALALDAYYAQGGRRKA